MGNQQSCYEPCSILPRNFSTTSSSSTPKRLLSSFIAVVKSKSPSPSPPWIVVSVETSPGVTQLFNPFTRTPIENVDLKEFRWTRRENGYHIVDDEHGYSLFCPGSSFYVKAVALLPNPNSVEEFQVFATFDDGLVRKSRPFDRRHACFQKAFIHSSGFISIRFIDDIITYKNKVYVLQERKELYVICNEYDNDSHYCKAVVCRNLFNFDVDSDERVKLRKRLVVSPSGKTLYMVQPIRPSRSGTKQQHPSGAIHIDLYFKVYELDSNNRRWHQLSSLMDGDADCKTEVVLFVTRDHCFFMAAHEFLTGSLADCIVFSDDAFPEYVDNRWDYTNKRGNQVAVFSLHKEDEFSVPIQSFPNFPVVYWSTPPPWASPNASSQRLLALYEPEAEKVRMAQPASHNKDAEDDLPAFAKAAARFDVVNGGQGWVKLKRCKCEPPKYCNIINDVLDEDRLYYECYKCGEYDLVGEAEFVIRSNNEPQVVDGSWKN